MVCSAASRFVTTTSSVAIGKSSSAGSSTSSPSGRLPLSSTLRRAAMASDIARLQHGRRRGIEQLGPSADALHEDALGARGALEIRHGPARRGVGQPVGTDAPFLVGQANVLIRGSRLPPTSAPPASGSPPSCRREAGVDAATDRNQTTNPVPTR